MPLQGTWKFATSKTASAFSLSAPRVESLLKFSGFPIGWDFILSCVKIESTEKNSIQSGVNQCRRDQPQYPKTHQDRAYIGSRDAGLGAQRLAVQTGEAQFVEFLVGGALAAEFGAQVGQFLDIAALGDPACA